MMQTDLKYIRISHTDELYKTSMIEMQDNTHSTSDFSLYSNSEAPISGLRK